jgi:hypothetical protein
MGKSVPSFFGCASTVVKEFGQATRLHRLSTQKAGVDSRGAASFMIILIVESIFGGAMARGGARPGAGARKLPDAAKLKTASFTLSQPMLKRLAEHAEEQGKSRSWIVESALAAYLRDDRR